MVAFLQQVFTILTSQPGSLAYNLVLAFSIVAALLVCLIQWRNVASPQAGQIARRILCGLSLLLALRLFLFLCAGLAWQQIIRAELILPVLERAIDLASLVLVIWLWAFPRPAPIADLLTLGVLLALGVLTAMVLSTGFGSSAEQNLNASTLDGYSQILALAISAAGMILLISLRPTWWSSAVLMLLILSAGHLMQLIIPMDGDYPGPIRLAQMIAFPLLIALPFRLPALLGIAPGAALAAGAPQDLSAGQPIDPQVQRLVLEWIQAPDPRQAGVRLAAALARRLQADMCLFLWPPDAERQVSVRYGYDLLHRLPVPDLQIPAANLPVLVQAFAQNRALRLPGNSTVPDMRELMRQLDLKRSGALLSVPVRTSDDRAVVQVVMLSPFSGRSWSPEDQAQLQAISSPLAHILQRNRQITAIQDALDQAHEDLAAMQAQIDKAESDRENLRGLVSILQQQPASDLLDSSQQAAITPAAVAASAGQAGINTDSDPAGLKGEGNQRE